jgi:hypothetical protein
MNEDFGYPLPECALAEFCCRKPGALARPMRHAGEMIAANGYVALRAYRGSWLEREHPEATPEFLARVNALPWERYKALAADDWRALADVRALLYKRGRMAMLRTGTARLAPSPVWRVGSVLVRLTLLQLIDRLPRCEVWAGAAAPGDPLWFRFTGGRGAIAADARLKESSFSIFQPVFNEWTGQFEKFRPGNAGKVCLPIPYKTPWPPADTSET